ncbi:hypothetical protein [Pantanalinema sp. GBBB05]|uniref:hypothetical protein n=1 Tax=Pantanalinema sp. GBBB05 TaxID=2604139 RepID=UPI001D35B3DF|nr:hypothetical protein [Pantanalinema sp. GBBB05]
MDDFVKKAAGFGLPAVLLLIAMTTTGKTGPEGAKAALEKMGGLIPGAVLLGLTGTIASLVATYGLEKLLVEIYHQRHRNGERRRHLFWEIKWLPISTGLKLRLYEAIGA